MGKAERHTLSPERGARIFHTNEKQTQNQSMGQVETNIKKDGRKRWKMRVRANLDPRKKPINLTSTQIKESIFSYGK